MPMRSRPTTSIALVASLALVAACGGGNPEPRTPAPPTPPPPTSTPPAATTAPAPPAPPPDPFALRSPLRKETLPALPTQSPEGEVWDRVEKVKVPKADATCASYTKRSAPLAADACKDPGKARAALEKALGEPVAKRDAALSALEACGGLPGGLVRALRAELAPASCGDAVVKDAKKSLGGWDPTVAHAIAGYDVAARLARLPSAPPAFTGAASKERVLAHLKGPFGAWFAEQAKAIEELSVIGAKLGFYGRALVAVEAGLAELRFVETMRSAPIPEAWQKDAEIKSVYYGTLDQLLEPRKARMRDALIVGLHDMAAVGVLHDARIDRARAGISQMYAGRRIDALDGHALGDAPAAPPSLLGQLPTFHAGVLLTPAEAKDPKTVSALAGRGLPWTLRGGLEGAKIEDAAARLAYARARFDLGRTYWRAVDHDAAIGLLGDKAALDDGGKLLLAAAIALREGPDDARAMMGAPSPAALNLRGTAALDAVAQGTGEAAGRAEYDAALLALLSPPEGAGKEHFTALAERFRRAAGKLSRADEKKRAEDAAARADATAKAL